MLNGDRPESLVALFEDSAKRFAHHFLFGTKDDWGTYHWVTYRDIQQRVDALRAALSRLGVSPGDVVGIVSGNREEFAVVAFAAFGLGATCVPMYEAELPAVWRYVIAESGVSVLFVSRPEIAERIKDLTREVLSLEHVFVMESEGPAAMASLERQGEEQPVAAIVPQPTDLAMVIYSSGTTSNPKGVMLSHRNLLFMPFGIPEILPGLGPETRTLSMLPWAHVYGLGAELFTAILVGGSIGFAESPTTFLDDVQKVRPTHLIAVPKVLNMLYQGIWERVNRETGLVGKLFRLGMLCAQVRKQEEGGYGQFKRALREGNGPALNEGMRRTLQAVEQFWETAERGQGLVEKARLLGQEGVSRMQSLFSPLRYSPLHDLGYLVTDRVVFEQVRQKLGGRLQCIICGAASLNPEIGQFFADLGMPIYDGYGLTEMAPIVSMNGPGACKPGTVGRPFPGVRVSIDLAVSDSGGSDGEIVVHGPNAMMGYLYQPQQTQAVLTEDGGVRTGDLGHLDEDGFLVLSGRLKEQYKLQNGKYVFPGSIEDEIRLLPFIKNAMVYGDGKPYNVCLVVTDLEGWKQGRGPELAGEPDPLAESEPFQVECAEAIREFLKGKFAAYEIPKKFLFADQDFTLDNGLLTHTLKLKRRNVYHQYRHQIESAYAE